MSNLQSNRIGKVFLVHAGLIACAGVALHLWWPEGDPDRLVASPLGNLCRSRDGIYLIFFVLLFSVVNLRLWSMIAGEILGKEQFESESTTVTAEPTSRRGISPILFLLFLKLQLYTVIGILAVRAKPEQLQLFAMVLAIHLIGGTLLLIPFYSSDRR